MEHLAEHFALCRDTTRVIEINKINTSETIRQTAAKHKWCLKERHAMIRNLLIPNFRVYDVLAIIGVVAFILLIQELIREASTYFPAIVVVIGSWGIFTLWEQLPAHDGWKVISDERLITKRLLIPNGTHLYMSGDSPFARGPLTAVESDGEG